MLFNVRAFYRDIGQWALEDPARWARWAARDLVDVTALETGCFWAWALIETLRLTGARIEEVLELTQLSLRHYTPPTTGTLVPLLHIAPSKFDTERLIPMSPELVEVILAIQRGAKAGRDAVPLSIRYDLLERTHGEPLPHLFARPVGARHEVLSNHYVRTVLNATAEAADLTDHGEPVRFTPHDFRRLFTTDVVGAGLPLHIAAALLGHLDLDTTRGYTAVFQDELITRHQQFITRRRAGAALAGRLGGRVGSASPTEAAAFGEVSLLAVPGESAKDALVAAGAADGTLAGRTLLDCTNAFAPGAFTAPPGSFTLADDAVAERVAGVAAGASVVKAFSMLAAEVWQTGARSFEGRPLVVPLCGDDPEALSTVRGLVADLGMTAVDAGCLHRARYVEAMTVFVMGLWFAGHDARAILPPLEAAFARPDDDQLPART